MHRILILLAAFSLSAGVASAQTMTTQGREKARREHAGKTAKTPEQRAAHMTKRLTKSLSLSADQTTKVRQLYLAQAQEMRANRTKYAASGDQAAAHAALKADRQRYDDQLKQILSAGQYAKFTQERAEHLAKRKEGLGQRKDKMKAKS